MTGDELVAYIRNDVLHDRAQPYLWSDDLLLLYLNEAERAFARLTYALQDNTSALTQVALSPSEPEYLLNDSIVHVYGAMLAGASYELKNYTHRFIPNHLLTAVGTPQIFTLDEAARTLRLYPVPAEASTLNLRVARLPLRTITESSSPEISVRYHLDLAEFVAMRCLRNSEVDGSNLGSADAFEKSWRDRVGEAKREYYRFRTGANAVAQNTWTGKRNRSWR